MAKKVRELMSKNPIQLASSSPVAEAARQMRDKNVGAVIVEDNGKICGVVTDRDIAIRAVAEGRDPATTRLADICSKGLTTVSPDEDLDRAVQIMREKAIRRVPVVDGNNRPVGVLSLGDLAIDRDLARFWGRSAPRRPISRAGCPRKSPST